MSAGEPSPVPQRGWARIQLPAAVTAGIGEMASRCGWEVRHLGNRRWEIRQRGGYGDGRLELLRASMEVGAAEASESWRYAFLGELKQDEVGQSGALAARAKSEIARMIGLDTRVGVWSAFRLAVLGLPDAEVAAEVQRFFQRATEELPHASLWSVTTHPWLFSRFAVVRTLFGFEHSSEMITVPGTSGPRLEAGRGLMSTQGFHTGQYIDTLLLSQAPWLPGIASARLGAMLVLLFGNLQGGRDDGKAELIDLYQPQLYSTLVQNMAMPAYDHRDLEATLPWWTERVSALLTIALDPANFRTATGQHSSELHTGVLLSLDRLFAVVNSILVASRRDEFIRTTLMFEALDIIDGLTTRSGNYDNWASPARAVKRLTGVEAQLPEAARRILLPRCAAAVRALTGVREGFFIPARDRGPRGLELAVDGTAGPVAVSWDRAVAQYLRLIRNGAHGFRDQLADPFYRALFSTHTGDLSPELADLPFLYLVWLLCNPWQLAPASARPSRAL